MNATTTADDATAPARTTYQADVLRWVRLAIARNHGRPVYISAHRIVEVFGCSLRTAERIPAALHGAGRIVYQRPTWTPDTAYESVHHMPGKFSLPGETTTSKAA